MIILSNRYLVKILGYRKSILLKINEKLIWLEDLPKYSNINLKLKVNK